MKVNYDEVMRTLDFWKKVNSSELKDVEWVRDDGSPIVCNKILIDAWKFIGMTNIYFAQDILSQVLEGKEEELVKELSHIANLQRAEDES